VGHHRSDASGLALVTGIRIVYNKSELSIIQVMVPPPSTGPFTMWTRMKKYLQTKAIQLSPAEYVMHTAERWAIADTLAGRGVIIMGDFNRPLARMTSWASKHSMDSLGSHLSTARRNGQHFGSFNGTSRVKQSLIDHILLRKSDDFKLTSIGGTMHPRISELSDHNPIFVGIQWPESPRLLRKHSVSKRITNHPDLPENKRTTEEFSETLDVTVSKIESWYRGMDITSEQAGRIQGMVVRASVDHAHALSPTPLTRRTGRGSSFKDGYSPEYLSTSQSLPPCSH
jgi:hypothetical protein